MPVFVSPFSPFLGLFLHLPVSSFLSLLFSPLFCSSFFHSSFALLVSFFFLLFCSLRVFLFYFSLTCLSALQTYLFLPLLSALLIFSLFSSSFSALFFLLALLQTCIFELPEFLRLFASCSTKDHILQFDVRLLDTEMLCISKYNVQQGNHIILINQGNQNLIINSCGDY